MPTGFTFVGELVPDKDGGARWKEAELEALPADTEPKRLVAITSSVRTALGSDQPVALRIVGNSMQPTILDNDTVIAAFGRKPKDGDIVCVKWLDTDSMPIVARYHQAALPPRREWLTKDNSSYAPISLEGRAFKIEGVVVEVRPRDFRRRAEGHAERESIRQLARMSGRDAIGVGFHTQATIESVQRVLRIPRCEFVDERLMTSMFRARARVAVAGASVAAGDSLVCEITAQIKAGDVIVWLGADLTPHGAQLERIERHGEWISQYRCTTSGRLIEVEDRVRPLLVIRERVNRARWWAV